jgi:hypothetical protein
MGGQGQRRHRRRLMEDHALASQSFEVGHLDVHEAVRRQAIRAGRVERDQDHADWRRIAP